MLQHAIDGRYRLVSSLTSCPGTIFEARDERTQAKVHLRLLESGWIPSALLEERRVGALVDHPAFVRVVDVGTDAKTARAYVVREWLEGRTLEQLIAGGPAAIDEALAIGRELLSALGAAHAKGFILPRLDPNDILVALENGAIRTRLVVEWTAERRELVPFFPSTPPEHVGSTRFVATVASNLYEVGALLHEILAGSPPFEGKDALSLAKSIRESRPLPLRAELGVPASVQQALLRALEKRPEDRFRSAKDFLAALS